jgi:sortase A
MTRVLSLSFVLAGLIASFLGVRSYWTAHQAANQAQEAWDRRTAERTIVLPSHKLKAGDMVARLSIDRLNGEWVVIEGADPEDLDRGPGHLSDTALPGSKGNCVIAGHRDTQFRVLRKVKVGEEVSLEAYGRTFVYRVTGTQIVAPTDTRSLDPTEKATLTLVTCYPFYYVGPAPKRFVIRAELVSSKRASG